MNKKVVAAVIIIVVLLAMALAIEHRKRQLAKMTPPANPPVPVVTAVVKQGEASDIVATVALIQSETSATVSAQASGAVLEMRFHEGDSVTKGQIIAVIDPRPLEDAVQSAQARLSAADEEYAKQKAIYERDKALFAGGAISQQALDVSKAQLASVEAAKVGAEKALGTTKVYRSYASLSAPYSGVVTARLAEPGDLAVPGKPLYTIQIPGAVKLLSKISQDKIARLKAGESVTFESGGQKLEAKTTRIYPALDMAHLGSVETDLQEAPFGLPSGATVTARYSAAPARGLLVPNDTLLQGIEKTLVIKAESGKAEPVEVTVLGRGESDSAVAAATGLKPGDTVILGLPSELMALTAGTPVAPQEGGRP